VDSIHQAEATDQWRAIVNTVVKLLALFSWVSERLLASQDGLCSMELVTAYRNSDGSGGVKWGKAHNSLCADRAKEFGLCPVTITLPADSSKLPVMKPKLRLFINLLKKARRTTVGT
jgi:hypothetical protein